MNLFRASSGLLLAFVLAAQTPAVKPAAAAAPDPKKVTIIEDIFRITKPEAMLQQMLAQYKMAFQQAATQGFTQEVRKVGDPKKYQADFTRFEDKVFALLGSRLDWQKMKPQFVQIYSDTFSTDELTGMDNFYRSPAGRATIDKMPTLLDKCSKVGQQQMAGIGPEIQGMMNDLMTDIKSRNASTPAKPAAKP